MGSAVRLSSQAFCGLIAKMVSPGSRGLCKLSGAVVILLPRTGGPETKPRHVSDVVPTLSKSSSHWAILQQQNRAQGSSMVHSVGGVEIEATPVQGDSASGRWPGLLIRERRAYLAEVRGSRGLAEHWRGHLSPPSSSPRAIQNSVSSLHGAVGHPSSLSTEFLISRQ